VPKVCGDNTECSIQNDAAACTCKAGYTGAPHLGCTPILYCASNSQCPTTTKCNNGICTREYSFLAVRKSMVRNDRVLFDLVLFYSGMQLGAGLRGQRIVHRRHLQADVPRQHQLPGISVLSKQHLRPGIAMFPERRLRNHANV